MTHLFKIIFLTFLIGSQNLLAEANLGVEELQPTFLLPIDHANKPATNLKVTIPKGFTSIQPLNSFVSPNAYIIEYIPNGESPNDWSEIITINKFIGKKIDVITFVNMLKTELAMKAKLNKVIFYDSKKDLKTNKAEFIMQYLIDQKNEMIGVVYYSGAFDAAGTQYTIRLNKNMNAETAKNKIQAFFKDNVSLIQE